MNCHVFIYSGFIYSRFVHSYLGVFRQEIQFKFVSFNHIILTFYSFQMPCFGMTFGAVISFLSSYFSSCVSNLSLEITLLTPEEVCLCLSCFRTPIFSSAFQAEDLRLSRSLKLPLSHDVRLTDVSLAVMETEHNAILVRILRDFSSW